MDQSAALLIKAIRKKNLHLALGTDLDLSQDKVQCNVNELLITIQLALFLFFSFYGTKRENKAHMISSPVV